MRYLGLDYGQKRIGVAVADERGKIAFPHSTIFNKGQNGVLRQLKNLIKKEKIDKIIVGLPFSLRGKETPQTKDIKSFLEFLRKNLIIPIEGENEILTTKLAKKSVGKERLDASAAAIILQSHLDKLKTEK